MKKTCLWALLSLTVSSTFAFEISSLSNNKESTSRLLRERHLNRIDDWLNTQDATTVVSRSREILKSAFEILKSGPACDVGLIRHLRIRAATSGLAATEEDLATVFYYLRRENLIDDILLGNLQNSLELDQELDLRSSRGFPLRPLNLHTEETNKVDVEKVYGEFKTFPDDIEVCSVNVWRRLVLSLAWKGEKDREHLLRRLNYLALEKKIIDLKTYHRLEALRERRIIDWTVPLENYLDVVLNAKDKVATRIRPTVVTSEFVTKYADRKEKLTQRERLYKSYSSSQVMMLADIIAKTAKRMDAKRASINIEYRGNADESEIYVLSPMERYRLSLKLLRKDMGEVMRSDLFRGKSIDYDDLVVAAFEVGLISSEELELILKFEDFWNPRDPKWKSYAGFAFQIAGTASFYLPPPWNFIAAVALAATQTKVMRGDQKPDPDDNWNVVI